jgi:methyl-accepting chemotaxis protein
LKITHKLTLLTVIVLVLCFGALIAVLDLSIKFELKDYFRQELLYKSDAVQKMLELRFQKAQKATAWFESSPRFATALQKKDRAQVIELGKIAMDSFDLEYFVVTDDAGKVFARAHEPANFGDSISGQKNIINALQGERAVFLEEGNVVKYSIRAGVPLRNQDGKIIGAISTGYVLSSEKFVDEIKRTFDCEATIFNGSTRIATTLMTDGKRIVDTKLNNPEIENEVLKKGQRYIGESSIMGNQYLASYQPLFDEKKSATGMIFIGKKISILQVLMNRIIEWNGIAFVVIFLVLAGTILITIRRSLHPLVAISKQLSENENDLRVHFDDRVRNEVGMVAHQFNGYFEKLRELILELKTISRQGKDVGTVLSSNATEVSATAEEISATMQSILGKIESLGGSLTEVKSSVGDIDSKIEQVFSKIQNQSSSVSQSSASIEELAASILGMNKVTKEKLDLTRKLVTLAQNGEQDMNQTIGAIKRISDSAEDIEGFVAVIGTVADQTNLLAMNAAIEAAHAGQFGKGFAVVADEIRKLSEETANNAIGIRNTIREVMNSIREADATTQKTGESIGGIITGIKNISDAMDEMSAGMNEITLGTDQIREALIILVSTTQDIQNAGDGVKKESELIRRAIEIIADRSHDTVQAVSEIAIGLNEIMKSMNFLSEKGVENAESNDKLGLQIGKFITE